MTQKFMTLAELMAGEEERLMEITKAEMAAEKAAFDALSEEEKARLWEASEAKWAAFDDACKASEAASEEDDDEPEDDDE